MWEDRGIPAGLDYRFSLAGYDDAVESWDEEVTRLAAENRVPGRDQVLYSPDGDD